MAEDCERKIVILHVGIHKTGTTAIQLALRGYDDGETIYAELGDPNHSVLFQTLFEDGHLSDHWQRLGLSEEARQRLVSEQFTVLDNQLARERRRVIFSGENISLLSVEELVRLRSYFAARHCDIQCVVFLRDPLAWTSSILQETVKHASLPDDFGRRGDPVRAWLRKRLDNLIEAFGRSNVMIRRYEDAKCNGNSGDIVSYFFDLLKLRKDYISIIERQNVSISEATLKVLLAFNQSGAVHNVGLMLERVRWNFIGCLEAALSTSGAKKLDIKDFARFVDWEDYRRLNELWEIPSDLQEHSCEAGQTGDFETYWGRIDEMAVSAALHAALGKFELGQPQNASTAELASLLFYGVMREDAEEPLKRILDVTQRQLDSIQQQLERVQSELESTQRQLENGRQQLHEIEATRLWRLRQNLIKTTKSVGKFVGIS